MALIGNYAVLLKSCGRSLGGPALSGDRSNWNRSGSMRNLSVGWSPFDRKSGVPNGYAQDGWVWPPKGGGMSSYTQCTSSATATMNLAMGKDLSGTSAGSGSLTDALLALIVGLSGQADGFGAFGSANLAGIMDMSGHADGTSVAQLALSLLVGMIGNSAGVGGASATLRGDAYLDGTTEDTGALTSDAIASAVWSALTASNDNPGTMGEKLNAAGSAGDPWITELPGDYVSGQAGNILAALSQLTLASISDAIGERVVEGALTVDEVVRIILSALSGRSSGTGSSTETYKSVDGDTARITVDFDSQGNRTSVVLDGS